MAWRIDGRIPVVASANPASLAAALAEGSPAAVLAEAQAPAIPAGGQAVQTFEATPPHPSGCACCTGRSAAAVALDRLFQARARGQCGWFDRVLMLARTQAGTDAVAEALRSDALTAARFKAAG